MKTAHELDKRGTGLSDRIANTPTLEERMKDERTLLLILAGSHARRIRTDSAVWCVLDFRTL